MTSSDESLFDRIQSFSSSQSPFYFWFKTPNIIKISLIIILLLVSIILSYKITYNKSKQTYTNLNGNHNNDEVRISDQNIYVDISGAVNKPGVYSVKNGSRLFQLIDIADGLSIEADREFLARNYNLAIPVEDQQKIYIPKITDVENGLFTENIKNVSTKVNQLSDDTEFVNQSKSINNKISINTASVAELESLSGVGEVTAQRIISGRPYNSVDDLLSKDIVKQALFDKIAQFLSQ
ncbi:MAG: helix-hairpin-helix domain-containing protein [Patescibacteria group bacterium]